MVVNLIFRAPHAHIHGGFVLPQIVFTMKNINRFFNIFGLVVDLLTFIFKWGKEHHTDREHNAD